MYNRTYYIWNYLGKKKTKSKSNHFWLLQFAMHTRMNLNKGMVLNKYELRLRRSHKSIPIVCTTCTTEKKRINFMIEKRNQQKKNGKKKEKI